MKNITIKRIIVTTEPGANISDTAAEILAISKTNNCSVQTYFNGILIEATPNITSHMYIVSNYYGARSPVHIQQPTTGNLNNEH
jgi:hypothetical protein